MRKYKGVILAMIISVVACSLVIGAYYIWAYYNAEGTPKAHTIAYRDNFERQLWGYGANGEPGNIYRDDKDRIVYEYADDNGVEYLYRQCPDYGSARNAFNGDINFILTCCTHRTPLTDNTLRNGSKFYAHDENTGDCYAMCLFYNVSVFIKANGDEDYFDTFCDTCDLIMDID